MNELHSSIFGLISVDEHSDGRPDGLRLWNADKLVYPKFGTEAFEILFLANFVNDPTFLGDAVTAHNNFLKISVETHEKIAAELLRKCRDFDELTGLSSDMKHLRGGPNLPPWVLASVKLVDRMAQIVSPADIWGFVHPQRLLYARFPDSSDICLNIAMRTDWDEEHGVQIVMRNGLTVHSIGEQDGFPI